MDKEKIEKLLKIHPKPDFNFTYGTAGFRAKADVLDSVMFKMGLLAALRSKVKNGQHIGVMVTASHNPVHDNGVKLVDPYGEMLEQTWEKYATKLARAEDGSFVNTLEEVIQDLHVDLTVKANVVIARDTRPSSEELLDSVKDGADAFNSNIHNYGLLTTPQLHYIVCSSNKPTYGEASERGYYQKYTAAFKKIKSLLGCRTVSKVTVDGANGIGGIKMKEMLTYLGDLMEVTVCNDGTTGVLNEGCGADFVKTKQKHPAGISFVGGERYLSFDGDADRIIYFYKDQEGIFRMLDGDKISCLIASFIKDLLDEMNVALEKGVGVVQTAYANGASSEYLSHKLKVPVVIAKTGVKHLHHKALGFDIGVYFEANGHGTVIYSEDAERKVRSPPANMSDDQKKAAEILAAFIDLTNQTVGDAISDMLLVETVLSAKKIGCEDWDKEYTDLPNKLNKVMVKDRTVIKTNENETRVTQPVELQNKIDELVKNWAHARSFVRPSGTEDVVRIYAESETKAITDTLSASVSELVYDICGGVGDRPIVPPLVEHK